MAVLSSPRRRPTRTLLSVLGFLFILFILRTPTSNFWHPFQDKPPPPPPAKDVVKNEAPQKDPDRDRYPRTRLDPQFKNILDWTPPSNPDHYPPYDGYKDLDYDPNRWEGFPQAQGLFLNSSAHRGAPKKYDPYPKYNIASWKRQWKGEYVACEGYRGKSLASSDEDWIAAYDVQKTKFPAADVGSADVIGLDSTACFDRYTRLGAYGLRNPAGGSVKEPKWSTVKLGDLQDKCLTKNAARYFSDKLPDRRPGLLGDKFDDSHPSMRKRAAAPPKAGPLWGSKGSALKEQKYKSRTAVLIRTWDDYNYQDNDIQAVRSMVSELSLLSGGEYHVFLLVQVKDMDIDIWGSDATYQRTLAEAVPEELRDIAILWNERVGEEMYPSVGVFDVYYQQFMPVQWFSKTHPEFDYIWNWEMDARLIGSHYHFLEAVGTFSRAQPRKYMWERNSRFYIPAHHGDFRTFTDMTHLYVSVAAKTRGLRTVWGPQTLNSSQIPHGPRPPRTEAKDDYEWGVNEEADLITLLPVWDPSATQWAYRDKLFNYARDPNATDPFAQVPRRAFINTVARLSKSLLHSMHIENQAGRGMASELWPASVALQHGWKAVYAPHPIWTSTVWPAYYADAVFNADGWGAGSVANDTSNGVSAAHNSRDGRGVAFDPARIEQGLLQAGDGPNREGFGAHWGELHDAPYSPDREHNFGGWSWYFWSDFARVVYFRWLGWQAGSSTATVDGVSVRDELAELNGRELEKLNGGRMCLPHMLLHPVKEVMPPLES